MSEPFIGEIRPVAFNFAPQNWAYCDGRLLSISQNTALFSLVGTYYGGNGTSNFALPNLQGRVPVGTGQGGGLSNYVIGQVGGVENVTLTSSSMPAHSHSLFATTASTTTTTPSAAVMTGSLKSTPPPGDDFFYALPGTSSFQTAVMAGNAVVSQGGSQPHNNMQPSLAITYVLALYGIYPSQN